MDSFHGDGSACTLYGSFIFFQKKSTTKHNYIKSTGVVHNAIKNNNEHFIGLYSVVYVMRIVYAELLSILTLCAARNFYGFLSESYYTIYAIFRIVLCYFKSMCREGSN